MNDDTDKLAAQMKNLRPSKASRERGMNAAMAAFNQEFAAENVNAKAGVSEKLDVSQGLSDAARPTGKPTKTVQVKSRRVETMTKFKSAFNFKPQTMMMAGTCSAALIAAVIVMPNMDQFSADRTAAQLPAEIVVKDSLTPAEVIEPVAPVVTAPPAPAATPAPVPAPAPQGGINDVEKLLNDIRKDTKRIEAENKKRIRKFEAPATAPVPQGESESLDKFLSDMPTRPETSQVKPQEKQVIPSVQGAVPSFDQTSPLASAPAAKAQGGINSINSLYKQIPQDEIAVTGRRKPGNNQLNNRLSPNLAIASTPPPPTAALNQARTNTQTIAPRSDSSAPTPSNAPEKIAGLTLEQSAPEFKTVTETIVVKPASVEYVQIPPVYETVTETVVVQEASTELVTIPPTYNSDGTIATPAHTQERVLPPVTKQETRRIVKTPAATQERVVPAVTKEVQVKVMAPPKFILRDDDGNVVREFESRDAFEIYKANLPTPAAEKPVSTFSVDVDTSSYSFLRASINRGQLPPRESIRLEEMINYFPYDYEAPKSADEPFKANVSVTPNPWNADTKLMHIGIKGYVPRQAEKPRSNLVLLIDTSGSMRSANKLPLLINSFKLLLNTLDKDDTVSIVTYASSSGTVLEPTKVKNKSEILKALNNLRAGGRTAGAAGLELAYEKAQESFDDEGVNRVILATDGDFNVGFSSPDDMKNYIQKKRETGIFLSVLGFGMGNYNDHLMQSLAQNGNGVAAYIDNLAEANKVLANEAGSALFTIAKDVKIQVEFNPAVVAEYRLIGYETRALKRQDFNNDKVDAGEIGAGHSVTAIYEMTPVGSPAVTVDELRYAAETPKANTGSDEYAFVKIRHKLPDADKSTLQTFPIGKRQERSLRRASNDMRFAAAVAAVGQKLRGDTAVADYSYADAIKLAKSAKGKDENGYRAEFIQLVQLIESLGE